MGRSVLVREGQGGVCWVGRSVLVRDGGVGKECVGRGGGVSFFLRKERSVNVCVARSVSVCVLPAPIL